MERPTLLAQASALKQRHMLEEKEAKLKREREELEIQCALAASDAKIPKSQKILIVVNG